jgi:hypothetical protein
LEVLDQMIVLCISINRFDTKGKSLKIENNISYANIYCNFYYKSRVQIGYTVMSKNTPSIYMVPPSLTVKVKVKLVGKNKI